LGERQFISPKIHWSVISSLLGFKNKKFNIKYIFLCGTGVPPVIARVPPVIARVPPVIARVPPVIEKFLYNRNRLSCPETGRMPVPLIPNKDGTSSIISQIKKSGNF
jgi:hypothetical protein